MSAAVTYGIIEEVYSLGSDSRTAYGIAAYADVKTGGTAIVLQSIHDMTSDREKLQELVEICNCLNLSTVHLCEIAEDFLAN